MTISRKLTSFALVSIMVVSSGCALFAPKPPKDAKDMLETGITNLMAQPSSEITGKVQLTMLGKDVEGKPQNLTANVSIAADGAGNDPSGADTKSNMKLGAQVKVNQDAYAGDFELRSTAKNLFVMVQNLVGPEKDLPKEQIASLVGKWWKIPLPEDFYNQLQMRSYLAELQKLSKAAFDYLKGVDYEGVDTVGGLKSYHYSAEVDVVKLKSFLEGYYQSKGGDMSPQQIQGFSDFMNNLESDIEFWVSMDSQILNRIKLNAKMDKIIGDDGKTVGKGDVRLDISYSNFGKAVTVEEPAEAQVFDLFGIINALGAAGGAPVPGL